MNENICQIAISVTNLTRSVDFYSQVLDMDYVFSTTSFRGEMASQVQGMENTASEVSWLIDDREFFQLEIFQFENPVGRKPAAGYSIKNVGFNRLIVAVNSLIDIKNKVFAFSQCTFKELPGSGERHALLTDPDGLLIELIENPELLIKKRQATLIGLGLTTDNISLCRDDFIEGFDFSINDDLFQHQHYWDCDGALVASQTLKKQDLFLVLSEYKEAIPRAKDYQLADIGVLNFALGYQSHDDFMTRMNKTLAMAMKPNCEPVVMGDDATVAYTNTRQGFSVEMVYLAKKAYGIAGFRKPSIIHRTLNFLSELKAKRTYNKHMKALG